MSILLPIRIYPETLRSLAAASIIGTYSAIGAAFLHPIRVFMLQNLTDEDVLFSFDGTNDHMILPSNGFILVDVTSNSAISQGFFVAKGTVIYAKQSGVPTTGSVYLTAFYGKDE